MKKTLISSVLAMTLASSLSAAVIATVNGEAVNDTEANALLAATAPGASYSNLPADAKKRVIQSLVDRKLILKEAKEKGIEKDPEYLKALDGAKNGIAIEIYMKKIFDSQKASDAEAKKLYDENKQAFNQPAQARAKHILVEKEADAKSIISDLKKLSGDARDKKFAELAAQKSIDKGSAAQGGELGYFPQSAMVKEFSNAVFAMKNGELSSKPIKSNFGYHVVIKQDFKPAGTIPFDKIKKQLLNDVKMQKFQAQMKTKSEQLRSKAKIEYK
ncbi:MAG: peptidylprolyl isomerase [Campylobacter sp.]|nr:peptidylprolyl isomerase [Campylobacter sp.]